jgi:hypothetical protein
MSLPILKHFCPIDIVHRLRKRAIFLIRHSNYFNFFVVGSSGNVKKGVLYSLLLYVIVLVIFLLSFSFANTYKISWDNCQEEYFYSAYSTYSTYSGCVPAEDLPAGPVVKLNENEVRLKRERETRFILLILLNLLSSGCWLPGHQPNKEEKIGGQETRTSLR